MTAAKKQQNDAETIADVKSGMLLYVQNAEGPAPDDLHTVT